MIKCHVLEGLHVWRSRLRGGLSDLKSLVRAHRSSQDMMRYVMLANSPNKLNLLSVLLIYLCNKYSAVHQASLFLSIYLFILES